MFKFISRLACAFTGHKFEQWRYQIDTYYRCSRCPGRFLR